MVIRLIGPEPIVRPWSRGIGISIHLQKRGSQGQATQATATRQNTADPQAEILNSMLRPCENSPNDRRASFRRRCIAHLAVISNLVKETL
jgi:hypothetical protein